MKTRAHRRSKCFERLDEDCRLDCQRGASRRCAHCKWTVCNPLGTKRHQTWHLGFRDFNLLCDPTLPA